MTVYALSVAVRPLVVTLALAAGATVLVTAQGPHGQGQGPGPGGGQGMGRGMMHDAGHQADMEVFHQLLDNGKKVTRVVTPRADGVESVTESDDPVIAKAIQTHLDAMYARVKEKRPIHQRDPLFREVFANADKIVLRHEMTPKGVKVVETSADPYVVKLIQAHADVVTAFIANGRAEAMKDHPVPPR